VTDRHDAAAVRFPPPLIPLGAILLSVVVERVWPLDAGVSLSATFRYWIGGGIVVIAFFALGLWAVVLFRRAGQSELPWTPTPSIEQHGPFRFTRNPMYLQMVLICLGLAIIMMNWWLLLCTPIVGWLLQRHAIHPEEAYLARKFGDEYRDYKRRVHRWL